MEPHHATSHGVKYQGKPGQAPQRVPPGTSTLLATVFPRGCQPSIVNGPRGLARPPGSFVRHVATGPMWASRASRGVPLGGEHPSRAPLVGSVRAQEPGRRCRSGIIDAWRCPRHPTRRPANLPASRRSCPSLLRSCLLLLPLPEGELIASCRGASAVFGKDRTRRSNRVSPARRWRGPGCHARAC